MTICHIFFLFTAAFINDYNLIRLDYLHDIVSRK